MEKAPRKLPRLPFNRPAGGKWEVKVTGIIGRYALSLRRRLGQGTIYPNEVVEKSLGVSATTRGWDTIQAICRILDSK